MTISMTLKTARAGLMALGAVSLLAGCGGIGEGNTVESLEIIRSDGTAPTGSLRIHRCLREQVSVIATFTDGSRSDFSFRANWRSSNPDLVRVSDGDIRRVALSDNKFIEVATVNYRPGTLVPVAESGGDAGDTATITAEFAGLTASVEVSVGRADFHIVPSPLPEGGLSPISTPETVYMGVGTTQALRLVAVLSDGQVVPSSTFNADGINPILWRFVSDATNPGPVFSDLDDPVDGFPGDFDKFVRGPTVGDPQAIIGTGGVVNGIAETATTVRPSLSLCAAADDLDDGTTLPVDEAATAAFRPATTVRVVPVSDLQVAHETGFDGDLVMGPTNVSGLSEIVTVLATLTTPEGDSLQNVSAISRLSLQPLNSCDVIDDPEDRAACTDTGNKTFTLNNNVVVANGTAGDPGQASVSACYPDYAPLASLAVSTVAQPEVDGQVSVARNELVTFTPSVVYPAGTSASPIQYVVDYGDGNREVRKAPDLAVPLTHAYASAGVFRPTLLVFDDCGRFSSNTGAALVAVEQGGTNLPPRLGTLSITQQADYAPVLVSFIASDFSDPESRPLVYEFDLDGDGDADVRQATGGLVQVYGADTPADPGVRAVDSAGQATPATGWATAPLTITNQVTLQRHRTSNSLDLNGVRARLAATDPVVICSGDDLAPPCAAPEPEEAFTYPGRQLNAIATFVADEGQLFGGSVTTRTLPVTRLVSWSVLETGSATEPSDFARVVNQGFSDGLLEVGQVRYLASPAADTPVDIRATPGGQLRALLPQGVTALEIDPVTFTVTPFVAD